VTGSRGLAQGVLLLLLFILTKQHRVLQLPASRANV
jgi:hypothetical protein